MSFEELLKKGTSQLEKAGIGTARLDTLVLLEDVLGKDRAYLLAHPEMEISSTLNTKFIRLLQRRMTHEPLAYIRGKTEFYGHEFMVNKHVLVPRPESETMVDLLMQIQSPVVSHQSPVIIDVGTGCGALGITAKLELPEADVMAIDIDPNCLEVAKQNAKKHKVAIQLYKGNLLEPLQDSGFRIQDSVLLCNLPYVPDSHTINEAAMIEPKIAIFGGQDGLDLYRELFKQLLSLQIANNSQFARRVLTESLPFQHKELAQIAKKAGFRLLKTDDFIQLFTYAGDDQ